MSAPVPTASQSTTALSSAGAIDQSLVITWPLAIPAVIFLALCIVVFCLWIYRTERGHATRTTRGLLALLRTCLLLLVVWMITGWSWQRAKVELPELVIALDVSDSMLTSDGQSDSDPSGTMTRLQRAQQLLSLEHNQWQSLRKQYQLRTYWIAEDAMQAELATDRDIVKIAEELDIQPQQRQQSRLGDSLVRIIEGQAGRGTAAIIFFSDGISTSGKTLVEAGQRSSRSAIPIHTVTLGRAQSQPDLRLGDILTENQVFLGDQVSVQATVVASQVNETEVKVQLLESTSGQIVDEQLVQLNPDQNQATASLRYVPSQPGNVRLQVVIPQIPNESDIENNKSEFQLQVQDRVIRVLLVFAQPSYEFRYLKHFLERTTQNESNKTATFELTSVLQTGDPEYVQQDSTARRFVPTDPVQLSQYDVYIFGPMDPSLIPTSSQQVIVRSITHGASGCIFLESDGNSVQQLVRFPLGLLLPVESVSVPTTAGQGYAIESTQIGQSALPFPWSGATNARNITPTAVPPVQSLLQVEAIKPGAQVLADAVSMPDGARSPLLITQFAGAGRIGFLATDETYRWTTAQGSDQLHQQFWGQILRWLCRSKLNSLTESELTVHPKQAKLGSPVRLQLRLPLGEGLPSNAELSIEGPEGYRRSLALPQVHNSGATYSGVVEQLPTGSYRAVVVQPALVKPPSVEFSLTAPQAEQANLRADAESMQQLAESTRGRAYLPKDADRWYRELPPGKSLRLGSLPPKPIWNQPWVAVLFIALITAEWLLRRRARML